MVTGTFRVSLAGFVAADGLVIGDPEISVLYGAVAAAARGLTVQIDIGSARVVDASPWAADRLREAFVGFDRVEVVGDDPRGVARAVQVFASIASGAAA